uniref:coiled-coil domain-containing protein 77 n=1 Tax=Myxine glutinosa TaxID=7769 RepID=UPI00358FB70C
MASAFDFSKSSRKVTPHRFAYSANNDSPSTPAPPLAERLASIRPSRELLDFYRCKVAEFDEGHEDLIKRLDRYKSTLQNQLKLERNLQQRETEVYELQQAVRDMQMLVFQSREQILQLYAENDLLKIRDIEDKKKIEHLLTLSGPRTRDVTYCFDPSSELGVPRLLPRAIKNKLSRPVPPLSRVRKSTPKASPSADSKAESEHGTENNEILTLQVQALHTQLEEQMRNARDLIQELSSDREIHVAEQHVERVRERAHIESLSQRLERTQTLLHESNAEILRLKRESCTQEHCWISEKDALLSKLDVLHGELSTQKMVGSRQPLNQEATSLRLQRKIEQVKCNLAQARELASKYREQCIGLEEEVAHLHEEREVAKEVFKERLGKMSERLELATRRCAELEKRRALEAEGFKHDIQVLQKRLLKMEKQIFKVALDQQTNLGQDLDILGEIRTSNRRTHHVQGELHQLKAKIYGLENDLRRA